MTKALIEVVDGGLGNSIQDRGRLGFRHMGITVSGCIDGLLARCANALVGNDTQCACVEIRAAGPRLAVREGRVRLALAGAVGATVFRSAGHTEELLPWHSVTLLPQDEIEVGYLDGGVAYLAVSGGIDSPMQLGSRSTYQRALIGGIDGQPLQTGNLLPCAALRATDVGEYRASPWKYDDAPVRVMLGPQQGHFREESVAAFLSSEYRVTPQLDRMGARLEGEPLVHVTPQAADIVSDGVTPGAIQVPGNGQPIILLADCQTVGGYPKIATVVSADLSRLGQLRAGQTLRFATVDAAQAAQARVERERQWASWAQSVDFGVEDEFIFCNDVDSVWNPVDDQ